MLNEAGDSLAVIAYHDGDSYSNADGNARISYYGISGVPDMWFDGVVEELGGLPSPQSMYSYYRIDFNNRKTVDSPLEILLSGTYDAGTRTGSVNAHITCTGTSGVIGLSHFALTETNIPQVWRDRDSLYSVCRDMLPDAAGDTVTLGPGTSVDEAHDFVLDTLWMANNCEIVVFVQQFLGGKEVYQAARISIPELVGVAENPEVQSSKPETSVRLWNAPNPFTGSTIIGYSAGSAELVHGVILRIYNLAGQCVRSLVNNPTSATNRLIWDGRDDSGQPVPAGVYFSQLQVGRLSQSRRMVVVR